MEQRESRTPRQARLSNCNSPVFGLRKPSVQRALFKTDGDWELVLWVVSCEKSYLGWGLTVVFEEYLQKEY